MGKYSKIKINEQGLQQLAAEANAKWSTFCESMVGKPVGEIVIAAQNECGVTLNEDGAAMLQRGERVDLRW